MPKRKSRSEMGLFNTHQEEEIVVWEPKRGDKDWMYPGQHEYPFEYTLSEKLPETMEES